MFFLTDVDRIAFVSGCVGLVGIAIAVTACYVCPTCWLNKKVTRRQREKEENELTYIRNSFPVSFLDKEPPPPYESTSSFIGGASNGRIASIYSVSSAISDTESVAGIPLPLLGDTDIPSFEIPDSLPLDRGHVNIALQYKQIVGDDKKIFHQLRIDLKEAGELPYRSYGGRCNPYVTVVLYDLKSFNRKKRRKSFPTAMHEFQSTVVKKSQHPLYNESFFFPVDPSNLKKCLLKIYVSDQDKLANDTILGEAFFSLKDASILSQKPSEELDLILKLQDSKVNNGQILLGLCYLPTAERMTVAVLKATNLQKIDESNDEKDLYVQAIAIYCGKIFERRKTSRRPASPLPVFNEMLMFDIPRLKLDSVVLLIGVYASTSQASGSEEEGQHRAATKDTCIGKVVIGATSRKNSLNHWNSMRNSPRRQVVQWHEMR